MVIKKIIIFNLQIKWHDVLLNSHYDVLYDIMYHVINMMGIITPQLVQDVIVISLLYIVKIL